MHRKTRQRDCARIVGNDAEELSEIFSQRVMTEVRVRSLEGEREIRYRTTAYYDFFFETLVPSGVALEMPEGAGVDLYGLFLCQSGRHEMKVGARRVLSTPGFASLGEMPRTSELTHSANSEVLGVYVGRAEMARHLSDLIERPIEGSVDFAANVDLAKGAGVTITALASALRIGLSGEAPLLASPIAMKQLKEAMIALLLEGVPHRFSRELNRPIAGASPSYVKRAIEFMHANISCPISAAEIAAACGVGVRALNATFPRFQNMPMMKYLREIRLRAVRQELQDLTGAASVAEVALKWGFDHMGRFSQQYQSRFGELPSQTLRRSRR